MAICFLDCETLGLCGPAVLLQYKKDKEKPVLYSLWKHPVKETLNLLEELCQNDILGYNLTFDWFQLCKINSMFKLIYEEFGNVVPTSVSKNNLMDIEYAARDGEMLKPKGVLDLYLHAVKGPLQIGMERKDITIRKIPVEIVHELCDVLNREIEFDPILFAGRKEKTPFKVYEFKDRKGNVVENFYNICCIFKPSLSLKSVALSLGIADYTTKFQELNLEMPLDLGFAPYAKSFCNVQKEQWEAVQKYLVRANKSKKVLSKLEEPYFGTWLNYLERHIEFWETNEEARTYAANDVEWLPQIWEAFNKPEFNDDDSVLACCVGAVRWHGYEIDVEGIKKLKEEAKKRQVCPIDWSKPRQCSDWVFEVASELEKITLGKKTGKVLLETLYKSGSEAGKRAKLILDARMAKKEIDLYDKLLIAGRLHASFRVIGALSGRMSGADGLNPQGINRDGRIRSNFPLATKGYKLCLGDFAGQEVTIFEAISNDKKLREDLISGKKIHGLFGQFCYPHMTYEEIVNNKEIYTKSKSALFSVLYGGNEHTMQERLGLLKEDATEAYNKFLNYYIGAGIERANIKEKFSPLRQDLDKKVSWNEHESFVESLYKFKRFFDLEFYVAKKLYTLSTGLNSRFRDRPEFNTLVMRNSEKGPQKIIGAAMSSIYATAFNIQSQVVRQALNHRIQSTGAQLTKNLQVRFWNLQPIGASKLVILPMSVHDEVDLICLPELCNKTTLIVKEFLEEKRKEVPLLDMEWFEDVSSWGSK